jgi:hypothetical protein
MTTINNEKNESPFVAKETLAKRYNVSVRTITDWKRAGLLVYFQVKNVVRFDAAACDQSLRNNSLFS